MEAFDFLEITYSLDSARARRFPVAVRIEAEGFSTLGDSWVLQQASRLPCIFGTRVGIRQSLQRKIRYSKSLRIHSS